MNLYRNISSLNERTVGYCVIEPGLGDSIFLALLEHDSEISLAVTIMNRCGEDEPYNPVISEIGKRKIPLSAKVSLIKQVKKLESLPPFCVIDGICFYSEIAGVAFNFQPERGRIEIDKIEYFQSWLNLGLERVESDLILQRQKLVKCHYIETILKKWWNAPLS